jgi:aryl-alcohol dehydrogenase-like predicted oxidoreductase
VPFFPLGSAFAGGPRQLAADPVITEVAARRRALPSQIALAWLLHRSERILLIPGTSSIQHLEENIAAGDIELDDEDMLTLEGVTQIGKPVAAEH